MKTNRPKTVNSNSRLVLTRDVAVLCRQPVAQHTTQRCQALGLTDVVCAKKRRKGEAKVKRPLTLGLRWPVERTNSWLSNFGQLRRNTDRFSPQRLGQIALAITLILTVKLVKWAKRWTD
jgi:transposase